MHRAIWLALVIGIGLSSGCVTRRYVITSDPPGAVVYRNGQPIGATPVEEPFIYYGKYRFRLVKDGYEPLDVEPELIAPWYQIPGVDFVSENLIPYPFRDVQVLSFQLMPAQAVRPDDIRIRAEELRGRGQLIQTPPGTEGPPKPARPARPAPAPQLVPAPGSAIPPAAIPPGAIPPSALPPGATVLPPGSTLPPPVTTPIAPASPDQPLPVAPTPVTP